MGAVAGCGGGCRRQKDKEKKKRRFQEGSGPYSASSTFTTGSRHTPTRMSATKVPWGCRHPAGSALADGTNQGAAGPTPCQNVRGDGQACFLLCVAAGWSEEGEIARLDTLYFLRRHNPPHLKECWPRPDSRHHFSSRSQRPDTRFAIPFGLYIYGLYSYGHDSPSPLAYIVMATI